MFIVYNCVVVAMVLLIAYWWANQGLFSAIIHLLSVIIAGALALAFWEPLTIGVMLKGGLWDSYAWGVSLLLIFVLALFILRIATNKLIPANVDLPRWANLGFGFPVGVASGVLTMGMVVIGFGFIQSTNKLMDFDGWSRGRDGRVTSVDKLWLPVHTVTDGFYSTLSVGAFSTSRPMKHFNPNLDRQSASLVRDSWGKGKGQIAMRPSQARMDDAWLCSDRFVVAVEFARGSRDYGEQLSLSQSQVRLVGAASGAAAPRVVHPSRWSQETDAGYGIFTFDHATHYATTVPGREQATIRFEFPWTDATPPRFIQIKNARIDIIASKVQTMASCEPVMRGGATVRDTMTAADFAGVKQMNPRDIRVSADIRPVMASTNTLPGTMEQIDKYLTKGFAEFDRDRGHFSRELRIQGIYAPPGTSVVQVEVGRTSTANIYGDEVWNRAGDDARAKLIDDRGNTYSAVGFIYEGRVKTEIRLAPATGLSADVLPVLPTAGRQKLRMLFQVTQGTNLIGLTFGDAPVASCNVYVAQEGERSSGATGGAIQRPVNPDG